MSTPNISTNIYLPLFVIFLAIILLCGCTPAGLHYGGDTQRNPSKPEVLYLGYQGARLHQSQIATLWWNNTPGVVEEINHEKKKLTYVGAGHEHILVYRAYSGECEAILSGGVALGMVPDNSKVIIKMNFDNVLTFRLNTIGGFP